MSKLGSPMQSIKEPHIAVMPLNSAHMNIMDTEALKLEIENLEVKLKGILI